MEAQERGKFLKKFLNRPLKDFLKISVVILLVSLVILAPKNNVIIKISITTLGLSIIGIILSKKFKNFLINASIFLALIVAASFSSASIFSTIGIETSHLLLPGVSFMYFSTLLILDLKKVYSFRKLIISLNGLAFILFTSILISYTKEVISLTYILFTVIVLLVEYSFLKGGNVNEVK